MIWGTNAGRGIDKTPVSPGDYFEWKQKNTVFQDIAASHDDQVTLTGTGNPQFLFGYDFSANYFSILGGVSRSSAAPSPLRKTARAHPKSPY